MRMNLFLKYPGTDDLVNTIFIMYDFKQISDTIMIVLYNKDADRWKKIFIHKINDRWRTIFLKEFLDDQKFAWLCEKLNLIIEQDPDVADANIVNIDQSMKKNYEFLIGMNLN